MKNYAMYYSYKGIGDVVIILFDNAKNPTRSEKRHRVTVIYNNDEIIGYNIFDIKEIIKIRNEGMIYYPSPTLVSIINSILKNEKLPLIDVKEQSGYIIGSVQDVTKIENEKYLVNVSFGKEFVNAIVKDHLLNVNDKVVVAIEGTFLNNGEVVKATHINNILISAHICTGVELGIKDEKNILVLDSDAKAGEDFFLVEEK